jgi:hypothetical protein
LKGVLLLLGTVLNGLVTYSHSTFIGQANNNPTIFSKVGWKQMPPQSGVGLYGVLEVLLLIKRLSESAIHIYK